jgi:phosphatidylglycerol:prolipoprotein diacylglycerol transferase
MRPVVFTLFGFPIHAYFFFLALGFTAAMVLATRRADDEGIDVGSFLDMEIAILAAAIVGSRVFFVAEAWDYFRQRPGHIPLFWRGGMSFYGGFTFGAAAGIATILRTGMPLLRVCDLCAPYITLGHIFGKVGCFFHGCCYGKPTLAGWGFAFPHSTGGLELRHPAQLYEFAGLIVLFAILHALRGRGAPGTVIGAYLVGYGTLRFFLELVRDDMVGPAYLGLFRYQWTSLAAAVAGLVLLARTRSRP